MGTNFYWIKNPKNLPEDDINVHIGKRSAAGRYCWDCGSFLRSDGSYTLHRSSDTSLDRCPCCNKPAPQTSWSSSAGVELGFAKSADIPKVGISSCSSFTWTMMRHNWKIKGLLSSKTKCIRNEYGDKYTAEEFLKNELSTVVIHFQSPNEFS
jgi:hypothetical protein